MSMNAWAMMHQLTRFQGIPIGRLRDLLRNVTTQIDFAT
jgi:hypothetical protein